VATGSEAPGSVVQVIHPLGARCSPTGRLLPAQSRLC
jgi:hypothetical protein